MYLYEKVHETENKEKIKVMLFSPKQEVIDKIKEDDSQLVFLLNSLSPLIGIEIMARDIYKSYQDVTSFNIFYDASDLNESAFYEKGKLRTYRLVLKDENQKEKIKVEIDGYGLRTNINRGDYEENPKEVIETLAQIYEKFNLVKDLTDTNEKVRKYSK